MKRFILMFLLLVSTSSWAFDLSVGIIPRGTSTPATCSSGTLFIDTDDDILYMCDPDDTWTVAGGGYGPGDEDTIAAAMTVTGADAIVATATLGSVDGIVKMDGEGASAAEANVDYAAATHASRHNDGGDDEIDRGTEGITIGTFGVNTSTPDVSNGGTGIHRLFKTANTEITDGEGAWTVGETYEITAVGDSDFTTIGAASNAVGVQFTASGTDAGGDTGTGIIVITDFDDTDDHSEFSDGDWFVLRCLDANTTIDFSSNANIEGNAGTDFTCSGSDVVDILFRWDDANSRWVAQNLTSGFSNPTTLAIAKAQFDYTIANPQAKTYTTDDDSETLGTDWTSSVILITGDDDTDADEIDLQNSSSGWDGTTIEIHTIANVDINDPITIDVEEDGTCTGCPFSGVFTMYTTGCVLKLRWDNANSTWRFISFKHPAVDWGSSGLNDGIDNLDGTEYYDFSVIDTTVFVSFRYVGQEEGGGAGNYVKLNLPYTSKDRSSASSKTINMIYVVDSGDSDSVGIVAIDDNATTASVYPNNDYGANWDADDEETRAITGQFLYEAE